MPEAKAEQSGASEQLHEAQARASAEKLFHDLLDAAPDAILEVDQFAKTPAIAMTAYAMHGDQEKALAAGFTRHISKPVNLSHMIRRWR